jgi:hypothetical protein
MTCSMVTLLVQGRAQTPPLRLQIDELDGHQETPVRSRRPSRGLRRRGSVPKYCQRFQCPVRA